MAGKVDSTSTESAMPSQMVSNAASSQRRRPPIRQLLELIRFSHTLFALPFAALACVFAVTVPRASGHLSALGLTLRLLGVLLCMVTARSAAMAFNRLVDAKIDAANPRTANRHLPSGQLSRTQVATFCWLSSLSFVASCLLFLPNWLPLVGAVPLLVWICSYSFAKRFTAAAHLWLGIALALSPICAWIALRGEEVWLSPADVLPACGLAVAIALWVTGFDIIYACQDADFDRQAGLHSIPARLGVARALRVAAGLHVGMLAVLALLPRAFPELSLGSLYITGLAVVTVLVIGQHALVRPGNLQRVNIAFFNLNALISVGFSILAGLDAWWR